MADKAVVFISSICEDLKKIDRRREMLPGTNQAIN